MIDHYNWDCQHPEGYLYRAESNAEKKERTMEDSGPPYCSKMSVEGSRTVTILKKRLYFAIPRKLTPFDRVVYWETKREQCMSCFKADERFRQWATCGNSNTPFMN